MRYLYYLDYGTLTKFEVQGSGVTNGTKYIIRTEVLYEVDKNERVDSQKP